jgi:hypothetical protein
MTVVVPDPAELIDLAAYPVTELEGAKAGAVVADQHGALASTGVSIMPGFLTAAAIGALNAEADRLAPSAHFSEVFGTPYIDAPDWSRPEGDPRRYVGRTALRALAYDQFPSGSLLRSLYEWEPFVDFIAAVLGRAPLYRYADPMGALNLAVMVEGDELGWHFDQTDFVVSIALQSSERGGDFESAGQIRAPDDERYDDVAAVVAGRAPERVGVVPMTPGTLMLFEGRHSVHRVTPIVGPIARYVALLAYDTKPDTVSSELLKLVRYGRTS